MSVKLVNENGVIPVRQLERGQLAVIVRWANDQLTREYGGNVVQRCRNKFGVNLTDYDAVQIIGEDIRWSDVWSSSIFADDTHTVRLLQPGETIVVEG